MTGLAYGAVSLGELRRAERAATKAARIASLRAESKVMMAAEAIIGIVQAEIAVEAKAATPTLSSERLACRFVETLQRSRAAAETA